MWQEQIELAHSWALTVVSDHCRQPLTLHPSISFQAFTTPRQTFGLLCVLTQVVESEMRGEGGKGGRGLWSALSEMFSAVCDSPPPPKLKQQVHNLVFHPFISAWIVVRLQRVKSMGIGILWKKCSQLVEQMDFSFFFAYFVESLPAGCWPWLLKSDRSDCGPFKLFLLLRLPVCRKQSGPVTRRSPRCSTLSSLALGSYPHVLQERSVSFRKCTPSPRPAVVT